MVWTLTSKNDYVVQIEKIVNSIGCVLKQFSGWPTEFLFYHSDKRQAEPWAQGDVQPWVYGTVAMTQLVADVHSKGRQWLRFFNHLVQMKELRG